MTEDEMVGWHHRFNGHEFEQTPRDIEGREAWHIQSIGSQRVRHDRVTEEQQQGLSTSLELTQMNSFLWLSTITLYIDKQLL